MIAKTERTQSNAYQIKDQNRTRTDNEGYIKQQINSPSNQGRVGIGEGHECILLAPNPVLDYVVAKTQ